LREILEEHFVPSMDWAELLGRDPKINRAKEVRRRVLTEVPTSSSTCEEVCEWLVEAFALLTNPQIAKLLGPVQKVVLDLTSESFAGADRNVRSRLRRLQDILRKGVDATVALPECDPAPSAEVEGSQEQVRSAADLLLDRVRPVMRGKRILFVSNREDETLQARLQEDLGCSVTVRDGGTDRKGHLVASSVAPGAYDLILVASSFISHKLDASMSKLAKQIGIPYVRVNKGRPLATIRALTRHFVGEEV
jgi:hypothetical protein